MFTGIIQNQGQVILKREGRGMIHFGFRFLRPEKNLKLGESIAVDGVCLTVAKKTSKGFEVDVVEETLKATTLSELVLGSRVNLERSLKYGDEMGGHFVSGHVDGIGRISKITRSGDNYLISITPAKSLLNQLAKKGSVALDGISLTVQKLTAKDVIITIIPHTLKETTLGVKKVGDFVNLEIDLITRYLQVITHKVSSKDPELISQKLIASLKREGF